MRIDDLIAAHGHELVTEALIELVSPARQARIEQVLDARLTTVTAVLENLHDAHNGAAALRSVEACGLAELHVIEGTGEPFKASPAVTIGCDKWVGLHRYPSVDACYGALRARGFRVYAAVPGAERSLEDVDVARPLAIAVGNERDGLTRHAIDAADGAVSIRMHGFTQSFNLSVSVALAVYTLAARRRAAIGATGDLPDQERARLRARWYALGVRGADGIIARYVSKQTR